jgi:hypothetical protein
MIMGCWERNREFSLQQLSADRDEVRRFISIEMKESKTPQTKKRLSLLKDCRNTYGEHDKSSRTSIRWRKSWVNRTYRRDVKQSLDVDLDSIEDRIISTNRPQWKKSPDEPLGKILLQDRVWEVAQQLKVVANHDPHWLDKLATYLCAGDLKSGRVAILVRQARTLSLGHDLMKIDLTWEDITLLKSFLQQQQPN